MEEKILAVQRTFQQKLKERDAERERNITKKIQEYEQKYDFINKALLESVAQITEMIPLPTNGYGYECESANLATICRSCISR